MSDYAEMVEQLHALEKIKDRAAELEERCVALQGNEARCRVFVIQLEGVLKKIAPQLSMDEQLEASVPLAGLRSILIGVSKPLAGIGSVHPKLGARVLRLVSRDEEREASELLLPENEDDPIGVA